MNSNRTTFSWHQNCNVPPDFADLLFGAFSGHPGFAATAAQMGADGKIKAEKPPEKQLNERLYEEDCPPSHKPFTVLNRKVVDGASAVLAIFERNENRPNEKRRILSPLEFAGLRAWDVAVPLRRLITGGSFTLNPA
jgi:hypothetical protein